MKLFRKKKQHKYINGTKGVISLFLCLIITPFLTVASALIEFSRYQNTESVYQEIMDCASLSTMANYDKYLQKRFGLFSLSQDCNISETYKNSLLKNSSVMEGIYLGNDISATGTLPLSQTDVIKRQILDFSESTVLTEIILEDLQLQALLDELDKLMDIQGLKNTLDAMKNMTTEIKELVEAGEAFLAKLDSAVSQVEAVKASATAFATSFADLYQRINDNEFAIDSTTQETETASLEAFVNEYLGDIQTVYDNASSLITAVNTLKDTVSGIPDSLSALKTAYNEASPAVQTVAGSFSDAADLSNTGSSGQGDSSVAEVSNSATSIYETLLDRLNTAIEEASDKLSSDMIDAIKTAADGFSDQLIEGLGLDVTKRWNLSEYYQLPLSDEAKNDIYEILGGVPKVWESGTYDTIVQTLKDQYVPDVFYMDLDEIYNRIAEIVEDTKNDFVEEVQSSIGETLTNLVNTINGLFDLDVFYDGNLNAFLDDATISTLLSDNGGRGNDEGNPYVRLLNAISSLISAVDTFVKSIGDLDFFGMIDAITLLLESIKESIASIVCLTKNTVKKIGELTGWVSNGEWERFGELLLMSGYMTHNLPNRTNAGNSSIKINNTSIESSTTLESGTLTGYQYSDILTPSKVFTAGVSKDKKEGESSLSAITGFMNSSVNGGTDQMFRGAELEYILAGTPSEMMNQAVVFMQLYFLRLLLDLVPIFTDPAVTSMAATASIACWAVYLILVFAEPLCDTVLLVNGSKDVYFVKRSCYLTPTGADELIKALSNVVTTNESVKNAFTNSLSGKFGTKVTDFTGGILKMDYDTHCLLIMMFTMTTDDILRRFANIVQLEARYRYSQEGASFTFDIAKAYTGISSSSDAEFDSFINIFQTNNSSSLIKKKFTRTQTY